MTQILLILFFTTDKGDFVEKKSKKFKNSLDKSCFCVTIGLVNVKAGQKAVIL